MTTPGLNKYGALLLGLQLVPGTPVPRTHALRITGHADPEATRVRTRDNIADFSIFENEERTQGVTWQGKSYPFDVELPGAEFIARAMFGDPVNVAQQTVTVDGAGAEDDEELVVDALTAPIYAGQAMVFGSGPGRVIVVVREDADIGATTLYVEPLSGAVADGATFEIAAHKIITPRNANFATLAPTQPLTVEHLYPGNNLLVQDVQIGEWAITMNARANTTATINLNGTKVSDVGSPSAFAIPTADIVQFRHMYARYGTRLIRPESLVGTFTQTMGPVDAGRGDEPDDADFIVGYERTGNLMSKLNWSEAGVPDDLKAAYRQGTKKPGVWGMRVGNKKFEVRAPALEINTFGLSTDLGRTIASMTSSMVNVGGTQFRIAIF